MAFVLVTGVFFIGCSDSNLPQSMGADSSGETSVVQGFIWYEAIDVVGVTGTATIKNVDASGIGKSTGIINGTEPGVPDYPPDTLSPQPRNRYSFFQFEVESGNYAFDISAIVSISATPVTTADTFILEEGATDEVVVGANEVLVLPAWIVRSENSGE